ncbi:MAG: hypothetical protein RMJ97_06520 [Raineya sp.]|nr:hypothetical protein [Raineya sp.]
MEEYQIIAVMIAGFSEKIAKIHTLDGLISFSTSTPSIRKSQNYSSAILLSMKRQEFNQRYDEALLSHIVVDEYDCYIEHNEPFSDEEIKNLKTLWQGKL